MSLTCATSVCPECGNAFPYRSNRRFCSPNCRKVHSNRAARKASPANAANSATVRREQRETFDLAMRMAESLYSLPPFERFGYLESVVQLARSGECPQVRKVLTNPALLYPDRERLSLFHRRAPRSYCTISQAADRYCRYSPWNAGVVNVVRGKVPEPPTGEVIEMADDVAA